MPETFSTAASPIRQLNDRSREVFRLIVDSYVETGEPVGSRTLSARLSQPLSPASIRAVMADLEELGLVYAPHTSAGRLPTEAGLRFFVSGLMEIGRLDAAERSLIESRCRQSGRDFSSALESTTALLSGLSRCAGLVFAPKAEAPLKHVEFVALEQGRALVVTVTRDGLVENRVISIPEDLPRSVLAEATNYLNAHIVGRTMAEAKSFVADELERHRSEIDALTKKVVEEGLAVWGGEPGGGALIVRGQANLLQDVHAIEELDRIRNLFEALEAKERMLSLLDIANQAEGVQIFIGSDNPLFEASGSSLIVAPFRSGPDKIVGAIGVVGPTRLNYGRIIPLVDFTAKVLTRLIG
ncbi:Heat-inducible transcription repressor HrcA [uncultured Alphaproteobacteria bacterium]|jgi:heat-inducible transcriptional repressor|uniref:Heat-inducible transcription repressor HrcA n=1 Tax=uncultured Alphaproteobacteria bacterium TaxID=91750 RepID=A0A212KAZ8_9PROT|nr:Heat-inducible transcription repressor HrcA [uncultured Alphaproteobacteria bacterium]